MSHCVMYRKYACDEAYILEDTGHVVCRAEVTYQRSHHVRVGLQIHFTDFLTSQGRHNTDRGPMDLGFSGFRPMRKLGFFI